MTIDLNDPLEFTVENVRILIASGNDNSNSQLSVSKTGIAGLSNSVRADQIDDLALRVEIWIARNDYVGEAAQSRQRSKTEPAGLKRINKGLWKFVKCSE